MTLISGSPEWDAMRRTGIGGSDMPAVLGLSKWATPWEIYALKTGELAPKPTTDRQRWGNLMQPVVHAYYEQATGRYAPPVGFHRHEKYPWLIGNPDGDHLEIKVFASGEGFGETGTDEVPAEVAIQCHHYMILMGWEYIDVAVPVYANVPRIYTIPADAAIADEIIMRGTEFWDRVQRRDPPEPVSTSDAQARWGKVSSKGQIVADDFTIAAVSIIRRTREQRGALDRREGIAKLHLMKEFADRGDTLVDAEGNVLATWKMNRGTKAYEVAAKEPSRRLLVK